MKKIIAILLVLSVITYNFGHIAVYNLRQYYIRLESIKAINNADEIPVAFIITLKFKKAEMRPSCGFIFRNSREFTYKGNMYDIIYKSHETKDSVRFVCFFDLNETVLRNSFVRFHSEDQKNPPIKAKNNIMQIELFCNCIMKITDYGSKTVKFEQNMGNKYLSVTVKPAEPPPKSHFLS